MAKTPSGKDKTVLNLDPRIKKMLQECAVAERRSMTSLVEVLVEKEHKRMIQGR